MPIASYHVSCAAWYMQITAFKTAVEVLRAWVISTYFCIIHNVTHLFSLLISTALKVANLEHRDTLDLMGADE